MPIIGLTTTRLNLILSRQWLGSYVFLIKHLYNYTHLLLKTISHLSAPKEIYTHYLTLAMLNKYLIVSSLVYMNILVQDPIMNYQDIHLLGKTFLNLTMILVFHLTVYFPKINTFTWVSSQFIGTNLRLFLNRYTLEHFYKTWWLSKYVTLNQ